MLPDSVDQGINRTQGPAVMACLPLTVSRALVERLEVEGEAIAQDPLEVSSVRVCWLMPSLTKTSDRL